MMFDLDKALRESLPPNWPGVMPKAVRRRVSVEMRRPELLQLLRAMDAESGGRVTLFDYCRAAKVSAATVQRVFGGWRALRIEAGLTPVSHLGGRGQVHYYEALVAKLKLLEPPGGPPLTEREFCRQAEVSTSTIERVCGSWRRLREAAGLGVRR